MADIQVAPEPPRVFDFSKASEEQVKHNPLLSKLKAWDTNGDGVFSSDEILKAASEMVMTESGERHAKESARRMGCLLGVFGFLLLVSLAATFVCTLLALQISKESQVPQTTGVLLTNPKDANGAPVGTSLLREVREGLSGLKMASKEELDRLNEVSFFHDNGYHRIKVDRIHRYNGRVEVWGCPLGLLVVEDTGEVHYAAYATPSKLVDSCWGPQATINSPDICGESVDNEPPLKLEVEEPKLQKPENAPTPSPVGGNLTANSTGRRLVAIGSDAQGQDIWAEVLDEVDTPEMEQARRLSSRRRSGSRSRSSSSSRSRSSSSSSSTRVSTSSRRRSFGTTSSSLPATVIGDSRRRTMTVVSNNFIYLDGLDGSSRRRVVNYFGASSQTPIRNNVPLSDLVNGTGFFTNDEGTFFLDANGTVYKVDDQPTEVTMTCKTGYKLDCNSGSCKCTETWWLLTISILLGIITGIPSIILGALYCCGGFLQCCPQATRDCIHCTCRNLGCRRSY